MSVESVTSSNAVRVLLADSRPMESQLLTGALRNHGFRVLPCDSEPGAVLRMLETAAVDLLIMSCTAEGTSEVSTLRTIHFSSPETPKVVLLDNDRRETVVQAFRSGARGIFCLADSSFPSFCECIQQVYRGEIWASARQLGYLLDSFCQTPALQVLNASGEKLLTSREEQVVALVTDGLSNRNIATELGLSEHTIKKYLFRIFEKLGFLTASNSCSMQCTMAPPSNRSGSPARNVRARFALAQLSSCWKGLPDNEADF